VSQKSADLTTLPKKTRERLASEIEIGENPLVIIEGLGGNALVATERRLLLWKTSPRPRLRTYLLSELAGVDWRVGGFTQWLRILGPGLEESPPRFLNLPYLKHAMSIAKVPREELEALSRLVGVSAAPTAVAATPATAPETPIAASTPAAAAWTVASPATPARTTIRKDILLTLLAVGIFAAVVVGAGKWGGVPATAPSMSPMPPPTAAPVTPSPRPTPQPDTEARSVFSWVQRFYANSLAPCYAGSDACAIDQTFEYTDGETWVPSSEFARITKLYVAPGSMNIGGGALCREALGSLFPPLMSIAVEIELLKKLRAGEAPPSNWSRVPGLSFEGCSAHDLATYRKRADQVRSSIHTLEQRLASLRTRLKKADVSGARSASVALAVSAADLARRAARDEDLAAPAIWSSLRQVAWDTMRISAWASVPRVAKQPATLKLIDSTVAKIKSLALDGLWP
jgi:hypothetical protein